MCPCAGLGQAGILPATMSQTPRKGVCRQAILNTVHIPAEYTVPVVLRLTSPSQAPGSRIDLEVAHEKSLRLVGNDGRTTRANMARAAANTPT